MDPIHTSLAAPHGKNPTHALGLSFFNSRISINWPLRDNSGREYAILLYYLVQ